VADKKRDAVDGETDDPIRLVKLAVTLVDFDLWLLEHVLVRIWLEVRGEAQPN